jgi:hypothetical protein
MWGMIRCMCRSESDRESADVATFDVSFGLLADVEIKFDRTDGARGVHLEQIEDS